jgi:hypothetical protein
MWFYAGGEFASEDIPQGLKPTIFLGFIGTAEAVPFQDSASSRKTDSSSVKTTCGSDGVK